MKFMDHAARLDVLHDQLCYGPLDFYAETCIKIRTKTDALQSLCFNRSQKHVDALIEKQKRDIGRVRAIILKGRQEGISTYVVARHFRAATTRPGIKAFILTHEESATQAIFGMVRRAYDHVPDLIKPHLGRDNAKSLYFDFIDSGYGIGTAGNKSVGRGETLQLVHCSEVSHWANADEHIKGLFQAVPDQPGTEIIIESTANGIGNVFHQLFKNAEKEHNDFIVIFVPWFWSDEYQAEPPEDFELNEEEKNLNATYHLTDAQWYWRRKKIAQMSSGSDASAGEASFKQEFPMNAAEAFQFGGGETIITPEMCRRARDHTAEPVGAYMARKIGLRLPKEWVQKFGILKVSRVVK